MPKKFNFKCKRCGKKLLLSGKDYGTPLRFFTCVSKDGCGTSIWINTRTLKDNQGYIYKN